MMEVFQYNCDEPGAGKHTRLVMEDFRKVPPPGLLWCGTSLSAQAIDISQCSSRSRFQVHFCKAFTINSIGATYKPEINAETMLKTQFKGEKILVLELGCNEVTNASSEMEAKQLIDEKMEALVQLANDLYKREKLQKVILLNRLPRCDRRAELSLYSDKAMQNALRAKGASDIETLYLTVNPNFCLAAQERGTTMEGRRTACTSEAQMDQELSTKLPLGFLNRSSLHCWFWNLFTFMEYV